MIELLWAGLLLIAISWAIQIFSLTKKKKNILIEFVGLQAVGIFLLILSDFLINNNSLSIGGTMQIITFIGAIITLILLIKKK